jgi:hypothetical protein
LLVCKVDMRKAMMMRIEQLRRLVFSNSSSVVTRI